ncbi:MAG TPA: hypothetical protein H9895_08415 [Candidatus Pseudogracilibacillus intestinigallinarum]|mgnify:CR=1 FL=1|uniref:Uncharacterized protein n=1 Tax=Candidatus Pseudogracilibacillus intestinigallinarum TaxID=2838742 RepID=A0A9D1PPD9_9BACI|nr:hypothetical protein [Candidatus Pseudogracilibacillus intestinigallinarum]
MIHVNWEKNEVIKQVKCMHANAKKYKVNNMLTEGNVYDVINETDEFIFVIDNSKRVAGYYKEYFEEIV